MVCRLLTAVAFLIAEHTALERSGFRGVGPWALGHRLSVVVAHGLSCPAACGILPDQGSNLCLLHWQVDSLPLSHLGGPGFLKASS